MLIIDYFEKDTAIIKNGDDSIFMDRSLLPPGAKEGDVLRLYPDNTECGQDAVTLYIVPGEGETSLVFRLDERAEVSKSLLEHAAKSTVMRLSIDAEATIRRREAIREFEQQYDAKND